jgi:hypothetical protein
MKKFLFVLIFALIALTGCNLFGGGSGEVTFEDIEATVDEGGDVTFEDIEATVDEGGEVVFEGIEGEIPLEGGNYLGTWLRQGTYLNGALLHQTPATLTMKKDSFVSTGMCTSSGTVEAKGNTVTMVMNRSDCPGGVQLPFTVTNQYGVMKDENKDTIMVIVVDNIMEIYKKK